MMPKCRLQKLREGHGISQAGLAMELHVSQQSISRYERGVSLIPSDLAIRIAKYFHVSVDYLLGITKERQNDAITSRVGYYGTKYATFLLNYAELKPIYREAVQEMIRDCYIRQAEEAKEEKHSGRPRKSW